MEEEKGFLPSHSGAPRKRYLLRLEKKVAFNFNPPALNLSPAEYNQMLVEIKKRGNMS